MSKNNTSRDGVNAIKDITNSTIDGITVDSNNAHQISQSNINIHKTILEKSFESLQIEQAKPKEEQDEDLKEFLKQQIVNESDKADIQTDKANNQTDRIINIRSFLQNAGILAIIGGAVVGVKTLCKKGGPALIKFANKIK